MQRGIINFGMEYQQKRNSLANVIYSKPGGLCDAGDFAPNLHKMVVTTQNLQDFSHCIVLAEVSLKIVLQTFTHHLLKSYGLR